MSRRLLLRSCCALVGCWIPVVAHAASDVWDGNNPVPPIPPSGIWGTGNNWDDNTTPGNSDTATFNLLPFPYTVTFNADPLAIQALTVAANIVTFTSSGGEQRLDVTSGTGSEDVIVSGGGTQLILGTAGNPLHLTADDDLSVLPGAILQAKFGSDVVANDLSTAGLNGTLSIDGAGSTLTLNGTGLNTIGSSGAGVLSFSNGSTGNSIPGGLGLAISLSAGTSGTLAISGGSSLTLGGNLSMANQNVANSATVAINGFGSSLTQTGASLITVGSANNGTAAIDIGMTDSFGTLTTGTGTMTINATGKVTVGSDANFGTLNANGNVTINGGTLNVKQLGDFNLATGKTLTIQNGGEGNFTGGYTATDGATYLVTGAGSTWTSGLLFLGSVSGTTMFSVEAGGDVSANKTVIGSGEGSTATATVTGTGSSWSSSIPFEVGESGTGTLVIEAGGNVSSGGGTLGEQASGVGMVTVTGAGSTWAMTASPLRVGDSGTGTLVIEAGGSVTNTDGFIGDSAGSSGMATVTGVGSTWSNTDLLTVGVEGTGTLMIEAGGSVSSDIGYIGQLPGSEGMVMVTGAGSTWNSGVALLVGWAGTGTLVVEAGGSVSSEGSSVGHNGGGAGTVTVTGSGSTWTNTSILTVGNAGTGILSIEAGGSVTSDVGRVGSFSAPTGAVTVTGVGSTWANTTDLLVGFGGTGMLSVEAGASVSNADAIIGNSDSSTGTVTVTGAGSTWTNTAGLTVGNAGDGTLSILAGGSVSSDSGVAGFATNSMGTVTVTGAGSTWTNTGGLTVGNGGTATLMIAAGGNVSNTTGIIGDGPGSVGTVTVTGAGSTWDNSGSTYVGGDASFAGGFAFLTVETGGTVDIGQDLKLWNNGNVDLVGGRINLANLIYSGGTLDFDFGTLNFTTSQTISVGSTIERALGGERRLRVGQHLGVEGVATLNAPFHIDGGGLEVDGLVVNSDLLFSSGVLEVRGGPITGLTSLTIPASGEFRASGVHALRVTGLAGSTIMAAGNLTLGDGGAVNGFGSAGTVSVGANTLTLLDANDVVFDSLALVTLGSGVSPGRLAAANGLTLDFGGNITGFGTVDTPNDAAKPLTNNGHIAGTSGAEPITLTGYVKGVGTLDNVVITGTDAPGFSPATVVRGSVEYDGTLEIEIGGTAAGSFDRIQHLLGAGTAELGGTLDVELINGFSPSLGDSFEIITAAGGVSGTFASERLPALPGGLFFDVIYAPTSVSLLAAGVLGDYNLNGVVDAADYVVWRDNDGTTNALPNDPIGGTIGQDQYDQWRSHFGQTAGSATGPLVAAGGASAVPEPSALLLLVAVTSFLIGSPGSSIYRPGRRR